MNTKLSITRGALLGIVVAYILMVVGVVWIVHLNQDLNNERKARVHAVCESTNNVVEAIRSVLVNGIKSAQRAETVLPQFKKQYEEAILQDRTYLKNLFVVRRC